MVLSQAINPCWGKASSGCQRKSMWTTGKESEAAGVVAILRQFHHTVTTPWLSRRRSLIDRKQIPSLSGTAKALPEGQSQPGF